MKKESEKTLRLLLLEQIKIHLLGKIFQNLDAADAVAFFIQSRSEYTDSHAVNQCSCNTAADTALCREADSHGKFTLAYAAISVTRSYIPQVSINARIAFALSGSMSTSPVDGQAP